MFQPFFLSLIVLLVIVGPFSYSVQSETGSTPIAQPVENSKVVDATIKNPSAACLEGVTFPEAVNNRRLWLKETAGENLALGKPVKFSLEPVDSLTMDEKDTTDLTDGKLSMCLDDRIWFGRDAVGWRVGACEGFNLLIDLGSVQPIGKVVARFLGGGEQGSLLFPAEFQVLVSKNGNDFYKVAELTKLLLPERNQADWKTTYWLPENRVCYTYPFAFSMKTKARYVGLRVKGTTEFVFSDEIAVIKGNFPVTDLHYASESKTDFFVDGVSFHPRKSYLAISTNINTPNFFVARDCRKKEDRSKPVTLVLETPSQVTFLPSGSTKTIKQEKISGKEGLSVRWSIPAPADFATNLIMVPYYLKIEGSLPAQSKARFYAQCEGYEPHPVEVPILPIEIPKVPLFQNMHISLAWMGDQQASDWPGFFDAYIHMGFNVVPLFPSWWADAQSSYGSFVPEIRKRGLKSVSIGSAFHSMVNNHKSEAEIYSQLEKGLSENPCPAYRGKFYQEDIQASGDLYEKTGGTDYYIQDIELWYPGAEDAKVGKCKRCLQWQADHGGKPMEECLLQMGTEFMTDLYNEIQSRSRKLNRPTPVVLMYDLHASDPVYEGTTDFGRLYPNAIHGSQPSLYMLPTPWRIHEEMQREYEALRIKMKGTGPLIPWLSTGTYGEARSENVEIVVLEALLNGATGFDYFAFWDFDTPMDYYYHAKALAELAPYQSLLTSGRPCRLKADNPALLISGFGNEKDEMLVLVGNYTNSKPAKATLTLPFKSVTEVLEISKGKSLPAQTRVKLDIPAYEFRLLHVRGK